MYISGVLILTDIFIVLISIYFYNYVIIDINYFYFIDIVFLYPICVLTILLTWQTW